MVEDHTGVDRQRSGGCPHTGCADEEVVVRENLFEVNGPNLSLMDITIKHNDIERVTKDFPLDYPAIDGRIVVPI